MQDGEGSTPGSTPRPGNPITLTGDLAGVSMPGDAGVDVPTHTLTFETDSDSGDEAAGAPPRCEPLSASHCSLLHLVQPFQGASKSLRFRPFLPGL